MVRNTLLSTPCFTRAVVSRSVFIEMSSFNCVLATPPENRSPSQRLIEESHHLSWHGDESLLEGAPGLKGGRRWPIGGGKGRSASPLLFTGRTNRSNKYIRTLISSRLYKGHFTLYAIFTRGAQPGSHERPL